MTGNKEQPLLVTAAVIREANRVLVARRAPGHHLAGYWEFPGGKIEDGESPEECLRRELEEELAVKVEVGRFLHRASHFYDDVEIALLAYEAQLPQGTVVAEFTLSSHDAVQWLPLSELLSAKLAPADRPIAQHLLLLDSGPPEDSTRNRRG